MTKVLTPMQRQYYEIKGQNPESILLFRLGDFYEMFDEDAVVASKILGITLTARQKGSPNEMKMCGIPYHAAENYINKLSLSGKKVAICEQVSDPKEPGIVKREVVRIITPGTVLSESVLDAKSSNYLLSVVEEKQGFGISYADLSTGEFKSGAVSNFEELKNQILKISPAEVLLQKGSYLLSELQTICPNISFWFIPKNPENMLKDFFDIPNLKIFYLEKSVAAINSAALILDYLKDTQKGRVRQITKIQKINFSSGLQMDYASFRNLEIFRTMQDSSYAGSLLSVIDKTVTAQGARKLKEFLLKPLADIDKINERLSEVEKFYKDKKTRNKVRGLLKECRDLERILSKIASGNANPKDLLALRDSLEIIPELKKIISDL